MFNLHQELLTDKPAANPEFVLTAKNAVRTMGEECPADQVLAELFVDPLCAKSWAAETVVRRIEGQFGNAVKWVYRTPGWLISWEEMDDPVIKEPKDLYKAWIEWSLSYDMPMNPKVWLEDPPHSSFPPAIAFKAALLQDRDKAFRFYRRIRELLFVEGRNISRWRTIKYIASEVGLDIDVLLLQYNNGDGLRALAADQQRFKELGLSEMPYVQFSGSDRSVGVSLLAGWQMIGSILQSFELPAPEKIRTAPSDLISLFDGRCSLSLSELHELSGLGIEQLLPELKHLEREGKLLSFGCDSGDLWCKPG